MSRCLNILVYIIICRFLAILISKAGDRQNDISCDCPGFYIVCSIFV